jgi:hypothetical protein
MVRECDARRVLVTPGETEKAMSVKEKNRLIISPDTGLYLPVEETVFGLPRECVEYVKATPREHYTRGYMIGNEWRCGLPYTPDEWPDPGGTWSYGDWEQASPQQATHVLINYTGWSDYSGSTVERSNYRSLLRDYPETFTDVYGDHGTAQLLLSVRWTPPDDGRAGLLDDIRALADYPLYDEEDHSALEMELADEAWDAYLSSDVSYALYETSESPEAMDDMLDAIAEVDAQRASAFGPKMNPEWGKPDTLRDMFYESLRDMDSDPYSEDAVGSVVFPYFDKQVAIIAERLWAERCAALPQLPGWFNPMQKRLI